MHHSSGNGIVNIIALPEQSQNERIRSDYSVVRSSLAKPHFKDELEFNFQNVTNPDFGFSSATPNNLIYGMISRGPHAPIKIWENNPDPHVHPDVPVLGSMNNADFAYRMVFYTDELNSQVQAYTVPNDPEWSIPIQFKGMIPIDMFLGNPIPNATPVYDSFHYAIEAKTKRWFYFDSGAPSVLPAHPNTASNMCFVAGFNNPVPANMQAVIRTYRFGQGADVYVGSAVIPAASTTVLTVVAPNETHDLWRIEVALEYISNAGPAAGFPVGTVFEFDAFGWGSSLNHRNLPGYLSNEGFVEEIKSTGSSMLLSNDQAEFFKNGTCYVAQISEGNAYPFWAQLAATGTVSALISSIQEEDSEMEFNAGNGVYMFLKPSSMEELQFQHPWSFAEGQGTGTSDFNPHTDEWEDFNKSSDYLIWAFVQQAQSTTQNQLTLRARAYFNIEYKTNNQWVDKSVSEYTPKQLEDALEKLRLIPQFYPNATHLSSLAKKIGAIGLIGGAAVTPASGPIGAGIAAGGAGLLAAGEILELLE